MKFLRVARSFCLLSVALFLQIADASASTSWSAVPGKAKDIAAGPDGSVWMISNKPVQSGYAINVFDSNPAVVWRNVPGGAVSISVGPKNQAWVVNDTGNIYRFNGQGWDQVPGTAKEIGVGANGTVWMIGTQKAPSGGFSIYRLVNNSWQQMPGGAVRLAVDPTGMAWILTAAEDIYRFNGKEFVLVPGKAKDIGVGADGSVFAIGGAAEANGYGIYHWKGNGWDKVPGAAVRISVDGKGRPWAINSNDEIYAWADAAKSVVAAIANTPTSSSGQQFKSMAPSSNSGAATQQSQAEIRQQEIQATIRAQEQAQLKSLEDQRKSAAAQKTARDSMTWTAVPGNVKARDIAFGGNNTPWFIGSNAVPGGFGIFTRDPNPAVGWRNLPGGAMRIAVGPGNMVLVVNDKGNIFHYNGQGWDAIRSNPAQDIEVGGDGAVWMIGTEKVASGGFRIYRLTSESKTASGFNRNEPVNKLPSPISWSLVSMTQGAVRLAVDKWGAAWIVTDADEIFRIDGNRFVPMPGKAKDISIGADGSVFAIGAVADAGGYGIYRWNGSSWEQGSDWGKVPGGSARISVDRNGRPWVINTKDEIYTLADAPKSVVQ